MYEIMFKPVFFNVLTTRSHLVHACLSQKRTTMMLLLYAHLKYVSRECAVAERKEICFNMLVITQLPRRNSCTLTVIPLAKRERFMGFDLIVPKILSNRKFRNDSV